MLMERSARPAPAGQPGPEADDVMDWPVFHEGDRVSVPEDMIGLQLPITTGVVVGADPDWDGYYLVRLDRPAHDLRSNTEVPVVREFVENITLLTGGTVEAAD